MHPPQLATKLATTLSYSLCGLCRKLSLLLMFISASGVLYSPVALGQGPQNDARKKVTKATKESKNPLVGTKAVGYVAKLFGDSTVLRNGKNLKLKEQSKIYEGDKITIGYKSLMKILFLGDDNVTLTPGTEFLVQRHSLEKNNLRSFKKLLQGTVHFFINPKTPAKKDVRIQASNMIMGVRGTSGFVSLSTNGKATIVLLEGELSVINQKVSDKTLILREGQLTYVERDRPPYPSEPYTADQINELKGNLESSGFRLDNKESHESFDENSFKSPEKINDDTRSGNREIRKPSKPVDDKRVQPVENRENPDHELPQLQQRINATTTDTQETATELGGQENTDRDLLNRTNELVTGAQEKTEEKAKEAANETETEIKFKIPSKPK